MPRKPVRVTRHKRSTPKSPSHTGSGKKPGPKTVSVDAHRRSKPK